MCGMRRYMVTEKRYYVRYDIFVGRRRENDVMQREREREKGKRVGIMVGRDASIMYTKS